MKRIYPPLIVAAFILCVSCKDKEPTVPASAPDPYFRVKVVEVETCVPVPDAEVFLFDESASGSGLTIYDHLYTDENGDVSWLKTDSVDKICVQKDGYFNYCGSGYYLTESTLPQGQYILNPYAWIRISVVDDEPLNPEIYLEHTLNEPGGFGFHGINEQNPYTSLVLGNKNTIVNVLKMVDAGFQEWDTIAFDQFTLNAPAFDTLDFVYHY